MKLKWPFDGYDLLAHLNSEETESFRWWKKPFEGCTHKFLDSLDEENLSQTKKFFRQILDSNLEHASVNISLVAAVNFELVNISKSTSVILPQPNLKIITEWESIISSILKDPVHLYTLNWKTFEDLIAKLLEAFGWEVEPMGYTKDNGIDLIAVRKVYPDIKFQMMVQCKRFSDSRKVGVDYVKNVWATKSENGFHQAMLATTSSFTRGEVTKAHLWNLELRDHTHVIEWCQQYGQHQ